VPAASGTTMIFNTLKTVSSPKNRCLTYSAYNPGPFINGTPGGDWFYTFPKLGPSADANSNHGRSEPATVWGTDLLLTDVISFTVRLLPNPVPAFTTSNQPIVDPFLYPGTPYKDASMTTLYYLPGAFDTFFMDKFNQHNQSTSPPPAFRIPSVHAIEITIRVWDQKTSRTRQTTII